MARILDLTSESGVYATRLLAEAGHDVIRVESPDGDALRRRGPFLDGAPVLESGADHQFFNAGKRSLTLDIDTVAGADILIALARSADMVIANLPLPIDEQRLIDANPELIFVGIHGDDSELCTVARSGLLSITGQPGERPSVPGGHVGYAIVGLHAAIAASAALYVRESMGHGQIIAISETECLVSMMEQAMVALLFTGKPTERKGYRGAVTAVSGAFPCADGYWMLSVPPTADGWQRFVEWTGDPAFGEDDKLSSESHRNARKDSILEEIDRWSMAFTKLDLVTEGQQRHIPATPVATLLELVDDLQLIGRGFLREIDHTLFGKIRVPIGAIATVRGGRPVRAPMLGEHSGKILQELGYSDETRRTLVETGVV